MRNFIKYFAIAFFGQIILVPMTMLFTSSVMDHYAKVRFGILNFFSTDEAGIGGGGALSLVSMLLRPTILYAFCFGLFMVLMMNILKRNKNVER